MPLLAAWIAKSSHILAAIYFMFLQKVLDQTWKSSNIKFGSQWKDQRSSYKVRQDLLLFRNLVNLSLD